MRSLASEWLWAVSMAATLAACSAVEVLSPPTEEPLLAGWYMQSASGNTFQACGGSERWPIGHAADLRVRAEAFGLDDGSPVYVKLQATTRAPDKTIDVARVVQFGSPTPVRDCAMSGVVQPIVAGQL